MKPKLEEIQCRWSRRYRDGVMVQILFLAIEDEYEDEYDLRFHMHRSRRRPRTRSRYKIAQLLHHPLLGNRSTLSLDPEALEGRLSTGRIP